MKMCAWEFGNFFLKMKGLPYNSGNLFPPLYGIEGENVTFKIYRHSKYLSSPCVAEEKTKGAQRENRDHTTHLTKCYKLAEN